MNLLRAAQVSPVSALSVLLCLTTIVWCIRVLRKRKHGPDRFLIALLGFMAVYQGLTVTKAMGVWAIPDSYRRVNDFADMVVISLYLVSVILLQISGANRVKTLLRLRLVEAELPLPGGVTAQKMAETVPDAVITIDGLGRITFANAAAERALGQPRKALVGSRVHVQAAAVA